MQLPIFSAAVFAGLAAAQFQGLPTCAQSCASEQFTGGSYGGCGTDAKCICENQSFISNVACCLVGDCDAADQASALTFASQICSAQGVAVPTVVSCASTAATATTGTGGASATATGTGTGAATATATGAGTTGSTASQAWAPRQTAAIGFELLGLAAAGLALL